LKIQKHYQYFQDYLPPLGQPRQHQQLRCKLFQQKHLLCFQHFRRHLMLRQLQMFCIRQHHLRRHQR
jgi:hypothetical protein